MQPHRRERLRVFISRTTVLFTVACMLSVFLAISSAFAAWNDRISWLWPGVFAASVALHYAGFVVLDAVLKELERE